jgi:hypothetical protein
MYVYIYVYREEMVMVLRMCKALSHWATNMRPLSYEYEGGDGDGATYVYAVKPLCHEYEATFVWGIKPLSYEYMRP